MGKSAQKTHSREQGLIKLNYGFAPSSLAGYIGGISKRVGIATYGHKREHCAQINVFRDRLAAG